MIFRNSVVGLILGFSILAAASSTHAQSAPPTMPSPVIGVIDFSGTVRSSDAGKSVVSQINDQHAAFQKDIQAVTADLERSRQELARQRTLLAPQVFIERRRQFQEKARRLQQNVQKVKKQLDASFATGMQEIEIVLADIVNKLAKENGINIVMNAGRVKGTVLFVDSQLVISGEALKRLNKRLPSVDLKLPNSERSLLSSPNAGASATPSRQ